ncbi:DUF3617 domain-containing protein [Polaromonas sp. SM01]|uniref:DUF3617 domain-containing protein n=1 Tax=Polaromonas sp. SM01 TaxID=3085630 RepID=UPI002980B481|nr:DUF3617 domain-containing protein [Polaromonas sp. SM01]MDW5442557.1 DUF3617 domain-containing protein [Polaromonas sp. SM01]
MKISTLFQASLAALAFAAPALAQTMKPGLWESTNKIGGSPEMDKAMAQMQQQMASMPPAQRKQMEDMMDRQGMRMGGTSNGGVAMKMCITKEMIERNQLPLQQQGNCSTTISDKTSSGMKVRFTCTNPPSSGEGVYTFQGDNAYAMTMNITSIIKGVQTNTSIAAAGSWLGSDCGTVKPLSPPQK